MSNQANTTPSVHEVMLAVMRDIGAIGKNKRNESQGFNFRGIDDAMNALHDPMVEHGLLVTYKVLDWQREARTTSKGGVMNVAFLLVEYTFHGPAGDTLITVSPGEAQDSGDKATNKALSAAFKYALLHGFCIPTEDMPDGDSTHVEAAPARVNGSRLAAPAPNARQNAPRVEVVINPERELAMRQRLSAIDSARQQLGWNGAQLRQLATSRGLPASSAEYTLEQAGELLAALEEKLGELAGAAR